MDESRKAPRIEIQDIDHLGTVSGIVDEIGLVEEIDQKLGTHPQEHVSLGQAVKAMILNGLGFLSAPLYLFGEFFTGKATEHLLGAGIKPQHLNDDRLGRVLDKLFEACLTELFVGVAGKAAQRFGVSTQSVYLDSTSFHLHGEYGTGDEGGPEEIRITHGYSRDHRPDLKQFVVDLMSTKDGAIPLFLRVADGNEADQSVFSALLTDFRQRMDLDALFVADSALYRAQSLASLGELRWPCRVPLLTLERARRVLAEAPQEAFVRSPIHEGYRLYETKSDYGGVPQRGLVVESKELRKPLASGLSDVFCGGSESWPGNLPPCPRDLCLPGGCEGGHRSVRRRAFGESSSADRYGDRRDGPLWQAWQARQGSRAQRGPLPYKG